MDRLQRFRSALAFAATMVIVVADAQAQTASPGRPAIVAAARDIVSKARYASFITVDPQGYPQARIVDPFAPEDDWTIWVATNSRTRKAAQIAANPRVTLLYFDAARESYVTLIGSARLVRDAEEKTKRWKGEWKAFYKDGPRGDDFLLIRIEPERLEVVSTLLGMNNDPTTWRPVTMDLR